MEKIVFKKLQAALKRIPEELQDKEVNVGWQSNIKEENGIPVSYVATIHEFGAPEQNIPPRPMLGPTLKNNQEAYLKFLRLASKQVQRGEINGQDVLDTLGEMVSSDVKKTIAQIQDPPLSPITLMLRKMRKQNPELKVSGKIVGEAAIKVKAKEDYSGVSTKPLIDSSTMINAISHEVVKK